MADWREIDGEKSMFYSWNTFGGSRLPSLEFTYTVLYMEFLHKNMPLRVFLWDSWSPWRPEWPVLWLEPEPAPGGSDKKQNMQLSTLPREGTENKIHVKQGSGAIELIPFCRVSLLVCDSILCYTYCEGGTTPHPVHHCLKVSKRKQGKPLQDNERCRMAMFFLTSGEREFQ